MHFVQDIKNGLTIIKESIHIFARYPVFIMPLFIAWCVYAPIILYLRYGLNWDALTDEQAILIVISALFTFSFTLAFSCCVLLELIQQLESNVQPRLSIAFQHALKYDTIKMLPIVIVWTIIWFILVLIQAFLSKGKKREDPSLTAENAARTLSGYRSISLSQAFFKALEKGTRMIIFLILPAIAWEDLSFINAMKKGIGIFRSNISTFVSGFLLTGFAASILYFPPALLFTISDKTDIVFPEWVWIITIVYIAFAWSYSIYLEQMFAAELYLWNLKWEHEVQKAVIEHRQLPLLHEIPRPTLLLHENKLINIAN